jgi:hypothetical protein
MQFRFTAIVFEWRGPAPYHFVALPERDAQEIADLAASVTYGWGMIPVRAWTGGTEFTTSLWRRDGTYVLPLKDAVRRSERIEVGDTIAVAMELRVG